MPNSEYFDLEALWHAVGYFVTTWGQIETNLTASLDIIYRFAPSKKPEKSIPPGLGRKLDLLKKCLNRMPELDSARKHGESFLARIEPLKDQREAIVHGCLHDTNASDGVFYFRKLDWMGDRYGLSTAPFDLTQFEQFVEDLEGLSVDALNLHTEIQKLLVK